MKALVFSSTKKLIYKTVPKPKLKKNETLIKVLATGICGSDMHAFNGLDKVKKKTTYNSWSRSYWNKFTKK